MLRYDYSDAPEYLAWVQIDSDVTRRFEGSYRFVARAGVTEVTYRLSAELAIPLPGVVRRFAEGRLTSAALADLKRRIEG